VKILQFGDGKWGQNHKRILKKMGHEVETVDIEAGCVIDDVLMHSYAEAVVVTTSSVNHFPVTWISLLNGRAVFCEKPVVLKRGQLEILQRTIERHPNTFMAGHQLTFMPELEKIRGKVDYINSQRTGAIPRDEGAVMALAVHDIAVAQYVFIKGGFNLQTTEGNKHNARLMFEHPMSCGRLEVLVQSYANIRLRHMTLGYWKSEDERRGVVLEPDNWNRVDLLELELAEFIRAVEEKRQPDRNTLADAVEVMGYVFDAAEKIGDKVWSF
jgi:predicted dehydrogenase